MRHTDIINAIENVIDRRSARGASDQSLIDYLSKLRDTTWKESAYMKNCINGFIDAIKQTPIR